MIEHSSKQREKRRVKKGQHSSSKRGLGNWNWELSKFQIKGNLF